MKTWNYFSSYDKAHFKDLIKIGNKIRTGTKDYCIMSIDNDKVHTICIGYHTVPEKFVDYVDVEERTFSITVVCNRFRLN